MSRFPVYAILVIALTTVVCWARMLDGAVEQNGRSGGGWARGGGWSSGGHK